MTAFHFSPRPNRAQEIRWREWVDDAFQEARDQNKAVLLAISAVWCHWCHVMDETTYSSPAVIDLINRRFVPVRVDNDRRPDVNARYNQGGWPTTAILTPDGEMLRGATYLPPDQMQRLLAQVDEVYADPSNRLSIAQQLEDMRQRRARLARPQPAEIRPDIPDRIFAFLDANFDEQYGGFGTDQKFPQVPILQFLLDYWARRKDDRSREIVTRSLHAMASGGMYDRVEGGFFRYSTTRDFSVPHFEKMLEDLSGLLLACARACAMFGDQALGRIAVEVRGYLDRSLWNPQLQGYGGSQDADEEYYQRDAEGRRTISAPYVDPTVYASWNAATAHALLAGAPLLAPSFGVDAAEWSERAFRILDTISARMTVDGVVSRSLDAAGPSRVRGLLADQAWSAWACAAAFEASGEPTWLQRATEFVDACESMFLTERGSYADRLPGDGTARLAEPHVPFDENALMARASLWLHAMTGRDRYLERARTLLRHGAALYRSYGSFAASFGSAALDLTERPVDVRIAVAAGQDGLAAGLRDAARRRAVPPLRVNTIDVAQDTERMNALGTGDLEGTFAYACDGRTCFARVSKPAELDAALSQR